MNTREDYTAHRRLYEVVLTHDLCTRCGDDRGASDALNEARALIERSPEVLSRRVNICDNFEDNFEHENVEGEELLKHVMCFESLALHWVSCLGNHLMIQLCMSGFPQALSQSDGGGRIPLHLAALSGRVQATELLLAANPHGARVQTKYGELPLHFAVEEGDMDTIKVLLQSFPDGALVRDFDGWLPLHHAAIAGDAEVTKYLLQVYPQGANMKTYDYGKLPLNLASHWNHTEIMKSLQEICKSDVQKRTNKKHTQSGSTLSSHSVHGGVHFRTEGSPLRNERCF